MSSNQSHRQILKTHGRYLAAVLAASAIMMLLWGQIDYHIEPYSLWDGLSYRNIAFAAPGFSPEVPSPFRFRLLGTYPVGLLPMDTILAFKIVNYALLTALVVLLYAFLCYVGIGRPIAAYTTILYTMSTYLFGVTVWYTFHTNDVIALILVLIAFWAMYERRWGVFGAALVLGALSRETWMLLPPTAFLYLWERGLLRKDLKKLVAASIPALAVFLAIRALLYIDHPGNIDLPQAFVLFAPKILQPEFWARQFGNSLKPLTFLPLIFFGTTLAYFKANKYMIGFILLTFASSLLGSADERLMAPAFVAFYWLFALIFEQDIYPNTAMLLLIAAFSFLSTLHYRMALFPLRSRELTFILGLIAWIGVTVAALTFKLARNRQPQETPGSLPVPPA